MVMTTVMPATETDRGPMSEGRSSDATAVCTMSDGTRAYALLGGAGDAPAVREKL
ncbi:hypothetical protein [Streptomyces sp. bgisy126]|uniref:hypothetical protein n=1 Tax=unclassified Streptomyces TaxID=2593676 RepID=UPI003EBAFCA1